MKYEMDEIRTRALECACRLYSADKSFDLKEVKYFTKECESYLLSGIFDDKTDELSGNIQTDETNSIYNVLSIDFKDIIAKRLGWADYDQMMLCEEHIDVTTKEAINWIGEFYNIDKIFDI